MHRYYDPYFHCAPHQCCRLTQKFFTSLYFRSTLIDWHETWYGSLLLSIFSLCTTPVLPPPPRSRSQHLEPLVKVLWEKLFAFLYFRNPLRDWTETWYLFISIHIFHFGGGGGQSYFTFLYFLNPLVDWPETWYAFVSPSIFSFCTTVVLPLPPRSRSQHLEPSVKVFF